MLMEGPQSDGCVPDPGLGVTQLGQQILPEIRIKESRKCARCPRAEELDILPFFSSPRTQDQAMVGAGFSPGHGGGIEDSSLLRLWICLLGIVSVTFASCLDALQTFWLLFVAFDMSDFAGDATSS